MAESVVRAGVTSARFRTSPDQETTRFPPGVPYIIGNEGCERFSYYGMQSILWVYMAESLYPRYPAFSDRAKDLATAHFHLFHAGVYATPMVGAIVADRLLGKYGTILWLSLVYCLGHAVLSLGEGSLAGLWLGLALIGIGSGGIKPCVSAHVGDQFGKNNWFRLRTIYQGFYFIINFGSALSEVVIPIVFAWRTTEKGFWGAHAVSVAFAIPGVLMLVATVVFFMGRNVFVHVPPTPGGKLGLLDTLSALSLFLAFAHLVFTAGQPLWVIALLSAGFLGLGAFIFEVRQRIEPDDGFLAILVYAVRAHLRGQGSPPSARPGASLSPDDDLSKSRLLAPAVARFGAEAVRGPRAVLKIMSVFVMVTAFWALFDQNGSSWIRQAQMMRTVRVFGHELLPAQMQALNPLLVLLFIPFMNYVAYPLFEKAGVRVTALRRMTVGMLVAALAFVAVAMIQMRIDREGAGKVSLLWQIVPYSIITTAEVLVSVTGLEFAYTQAPKRMKSMIMGLWLLTISLGNVLVSVMAEFSKLPLATFFWVFSALMVVAAVLFGMRARNYVEQDFIQD